MKQEASLISREYTLRGNISFVRQWKKYRTEWSKCVCVLVPMPFCFGELKRFLKAKEGNDNRHLTFISYRKSASVLRKLLSDSLYLGPVLEVEVWNSGVLLHFLFFDRYCLVLDLPWLSFYLSWAGGSEAAALVHHSLHKTLRILPLSQDSFVRYVKVLEVCLVEQVMEAVLGEVKDSSWEIQNCLRTA